MKPMEEKEKEPLLLLAIWWLRVLLAKLESSLVYQKTLDHSLSIYLLA
jgi:hypothetical protein